MLKLKLQYFGHLMQRTDSLEKTLMLGKIEGRRCRASLVAQMVKNLPAMQETWIQLLGGSGGLRPLVELCVEPAGLCGRCTGVAVPLRVVPSPTGLPSKRGPWGCTESDTTEAT